VPGTGAREQAEAVAETCDRRQRAALALLVARASSIDAVEGVVLIGSLAAGTADELGDVDALVVARPGRFDEAWSRRHELSAGALVAWDVTWDPDPKPDCAGHNWLTRELVKVDCSLVDPDAGGKELAEPFAVIAGPASLADRFPRVSAEALLERRRALEDAQSREVPDPDAMAPGELLDWKLSELKQAVRRAQNAS